jgi:hypothetical protein
MNLATLIREKYLRVYSVCIVQDDATKVSNVVQNMDKIFKSAVLTITAVWEDNASSGLIRLRPGFRNLQSVTSALDSVGLIQKETIFEGSLREIPWHKRGWCY